MRIEVYGPIQGEARLQVHVDGSMELLSAKLIDERLDEATIRWIVEFHDRSACKCKLCDLASHRSQTAETSVQAFNPDIMVHHDARGMTGLVSLEAF